MDEIINISVNGNTIKKDYNCAGVQGECNSTKLRITFSDNWDGFGKIITFWNALGQNPVQIQLGTNRLENILDNQNVYIIPIPGEAMTESGENTFVINGTIDGVVKRTVEGKLKVLPSRQADNAGEPEDPTPTEAAQLRQELDAVLGNIAEAAKAADAAKQALLYSDNARVSADRAGASFAALEQLSVSSETTSNSVATVSKTKEGGAYNFHFGIPKGVSGVHIGKTAPTDKDTNVWVDTSGEATEEEETEETVDQTYNPESPNAQSGIAVAEALSNIPCSSLEGVVYVDSENLVSGTYTYNTINADGSLAASAAKTWALWDDVIDVPNPTAGTDTIYRFNNTGLSSIALYRQDGTVYARKSLLAGGDKSYTIPSDIYKIRITEQVTNLTAGQTWAWEEVNEFVPYGAKPGYNYDGNPMYADLDNHIEEVKAELDNHIEEVKLNCVYAFSPHILKGINHGGYNNANIDGAPINTISAFKLSAKKGFKFVETDVRFTMDNVPVLLHNATIDATSNGTGAIANMTFEAVRGYDFGSWVSEEYAGEQIPSFEEFIVFCRDAGLYPYIELSNNIFDDSGKLIGHYSEDQLDMVVDIVKRYKMERSVTWISFHIETLQSIVDRDKGARVGFLRDEPLLEDWIGKIQALYTGINEVFVNLGYSKTSEADIAYAKSMSLPVELWTVDGVAGMKGLNDYISGVTSNCYNFEEVKKEKVLG